MIINIYLFINNIYSILLALTNAHSLRYCDTNSTLDGGNYCELHILCDFHTVENWTLAVSSRSETDANFTIGVIEQVYDPINLTPQGSYCIPRSPSSSRSITRSNSPSPSHSESFSSSTSYILPSNSSTISLSVTNTPTGSISDTNTNTPSSTQTTTATPSPTPSSSSSQSPTSTSSVSNTPTPTCTTSHLNSTKTASPSISTSSSISNQPIITTEQQILFQSQYEVLDILDGYIFFSFDAQVQQSPTTEVFITFNAIPQDEIIGVFANYENLAFADPGCKEAENKKIIGNGDVLTIDHCVFKPGTWLV